MAPTSVAQSAPPVAPEALSPPAPAIDLDVTGRHSRERSWMGQMQRARQATTDRSAPFAEAPAFQPFAFVAPPAAPDAALRRHAVARRSSKSTIDSPSSASEVTSPSRLRAWAKRRASRRAWATHWVSVA